MNMKLNNKTLLQVGATTLITLGALGLALTSDKKDDVTVNTELEDIIENKLDFPIRNIYHEMFYLATDDVEYRYIMDTIAEKVEEDERRALEEQRKKEEEQRKQEELERKKAEEEANSNISYEGTFNVTFYTAGAESTGKSKGDKWYGVTASGTKVKEGRTVACPKNIKFGTKVYIEGFGERVCEDRGSAINNPYKLDIYVDDYSKAVKLGRQHLHVKVYKGE